MFATWCKVITLLTIIFMAFAGPVHSNNSRPPRNVEISNVAEALKYLQDLDTYYGDRARVRFGKRGGPLNGDIRRILDGDETY